ncbi:unnamed protein product [Brassica oleracea]
MGAYDLGLGSFVNFSSLSNSDLKTNVLSFDKSKAVKTTSKAHSTRCLKCHRIGHYANKCQNQKPLVTLESDNVETEPGKEGFSDLLPTFDDNAHEPMAGSSELIFPLEKDSKKVLNKNEFSVPDASKRRYLTEPTAFGQRETQRQDASNAGVTRALKPLHQDTKDNKHRYTNRSGTEEPNDETTRTHSEGLARDLKKENQKPASPHPKSRLQPPAITTTTSQQNDFSFKRIFISLISIQISFRCFKKKKNPNIFSLAVSTLVPFMGISHGNIRAIHCSSKVHLRKFNDDFSVLYKETENKVEKSVSEKLYLSRFVVFILRHSNKSIGKNKMVNLLVSFWFVLISSVYANTCFNRSGFFAPDGTYDLNRRVMLSSLPSNVTANDGFYTTSTGEDPNRAYGLGMCFPGTEARSFSDCIMAASNGLVKNCTNQIDAIDWRMYGNTLCLVHYSNRSFYGSLDMEIIRSDNYTRDFQANMTDLAITWEALMIGLIDQASSLYYAARTQKLESSISHVYGVVQCSRDISLENCTRCLQQNVIEYRSCCRGREGGIFSRPSCFIRWEVYPFLALLDNMPPLEKDGKGISTGTIVAIVLVPILLLALGFAIWKRRKSHKAFTTASEFPLFFLVQRQIKT